MFPRTFRVCALSSPARVCRVGKEVGEHKAGGEEDEEVVIDEEKLSLGEGGRGKR